MLSLLSGSAGYERDSSHTTMSIKITSSKRMAENVAYDFLGFWTDILLSLISGQRRSHHFGHDERAFTSLVK